MVSIAHGSGVAPAPVAGNHGKTTNRTSYRDQLFDEARLGRMHDHFIAHPTGIAPMATLVDPAVRQLPAFHSSARVPRNTRRAGPPSLAQSGRTSIVSGFAHAATLVLRFVHPLADP